MLINLNYVHERIVLLILCSIKILLKLGNCLKQSYFPERNAMLHNWGKQS